MKPMQFARRLLAAKIIFLLLICLFPAARAESRQKPRARQARVKLSITSVPPKGAGPDRLEAIAGRVSGVRPKDYRIVIYALTDMWYVQPYIDFPLTTINPDGRWESTIHLGSEYAVLLVKPSFKPSPTLAMLPAMGGEVVAIARAQAGR
jgi:hypothetical protein